MKNLLTSIILICTFANLSSLFAQCTIVSCNSPLSITACDEFDFAVLNTSGFGYGSATALTESNFVNQALGAVSGCATNALYEYIDGPINFNLGNCPYASWSRTWNVYESGILQSSCIQTINLVDNSTPTITCPLPAVLEIDLQNSVLCDGSNPLIETETGFAFSSVPVTLPDPLLYQASTNGIAADPPCQLHQVSYEDFDNGISCGNGDQNVAFSFTRTWTVTDKCGNSSSCDREIRLMDFDGPELIGGANFFLNQDPNFFNVTSLACPVVISWVEPTASDFITNCGSSVINLTSTHSPGETFDEGLTTVCYDYEDECGNSEQTCFDINITCTACTDVDSLYLTCNSPISCDINQFNRNTCLPTPDGEVIPLCGSGVIHNGVYYTFVAGESEIDITIIPGACTLGQGVQLTVTDYCDPMTCYTNNGGTECYLDTTVVVATGLTVGNVYNIVIDGCNSDVCEFEIVVNSSSYTFPDPENPVVSSDECIIDPTSLNYCTGQVISFFPKNLEDETFFFCWNIDSQAGVNALNLDSNCALPDSTFNFSCSSDYSTCGPLQLEFNEPGSYELCLTELSNGCDEFQLSFCWSIVVEEQIDVDFGIFEVCGDELATGWDASTITDSLTGQQWEGDLITSSGIFTSATIDPCNCGITQVIQVIELEELNEDVLEVHLCANDLDLWEDTGLGLDWNGIQGFLSPGTNHTFILTVAGGSQQIDYEGINCDSTLTYNFFIYEINGTLITSLDTDCSVLLEFTPDSLASFIDTNNISYQWIDPMGNNLGTEITQMADSDGIYTLEAMYAIPGSGEICISSFDIDVNIADGGVISPPTVTAPPICEDNTDNLLFSVPAITDVTYEWTVSNGTPSTASGNEISISIDDPSQPLLVDVFANSPCGQSATSSNSYDVSPTPFVSVLSDTTVMLGETIILPSSLDMAQEYSWNISDPNATWNQATATQESNLAVTWGTIGDQTYSLQVIDNNGCISNVFIGLVTVVDSTTVNIKDTFDESQLNIFPNPTTGILIIDSDIQIDKIELYALDGAQIKTINKLNGSIDISDLDSGVYILKITGPEDEFITKVFKE